VDADWFYLIAIKIYKKFGFHKESQEFLGHGAKFLGQVPVGLDQVSGCSNHKIVGVGTS
jgi:hypothetical protein